jgi:hypothetical protein
MAARKPTDTVQYKLRLPDDLGRHIKRLSDKSGRSLNSEMVHLLWSAVQAERAGVAGFDNIVKAVQSSSAAFAVEETLKRLGRLDVENQTKPGITKRSE